MKCICNDTDSFCPEHNGNGTEAEDTAASKVIRRLLRAITHGRPSFPEDGKEWDRAIAVAEKYLGGMR